MSNKKCEECEEKKATHTCPDCGALFCKDCCSHGCEPCDCCGPRLIELSKIRKYIKERRKIKRENFEENAIEFIEKQVKAFRKNRPGGGLLTQFVRDLKSGKRFKIVNPRRKIGR